MLSFHWLKNAFRNTPRKTRKHDRRSILGCERLEDRLPFAVATWIGDPNSSVANWSNAANWSIGRIPGEDDIAHFTNNEFVRSFKSVVDDDFTVAGLAIDDIWGAAGGTVEVSDNLTINDGFDLASGIFEGGGTVTLNGSNSDWTGGVINLGAGGIVNHGTWTIDTTDGHLLLNKAGTVTNHGTIKISGNHALFLERFAMLNNAINGVVEFTDDGTMDELFGATLENHGIIRKTGGGGRSNLSITFNNLNGTLESRSGTLALNTKGGTISGGTLRADAGATLDLTGGQTVQYAGTFAVSGLGAVVVKDGTLKVMSQGVTINATGSAMQWLSGIIDVTSGGSFTNSAGSTFSLDGGNNAFVGTGTFHNDGSIHVRGVTNFTLKNGATLNNSNSGVVDFAGNSRITKSSEGTFNNDGTIRKSAGTGTSIISSNFNNHGARFVVNTGTLALETGTGLIDGATINVASKATLNLANFGTVNYAGTLTGIGAGTVALSNHRVKVGAAGLKLNFPGAMFRWTGGILDVKSGDATNLNTITFVGTGTATVEGAGRLVNNKTILHTGTGTLQLKDGAILDNVATGIFDFRADGRVMQYNGGTFKNAGVLRKTAGTDTGSSHFGAVLDTKGTVMVTKGTLTIISTLTQLSGTTLTGGKWNVLSTGTSIATLKINSASNGITTIGAAAVVTLRGNNAALQQLNWLTTINGSLVLQNGKQFTARGNITNAGRLTIDATSSLKTSVTGTFTQGSTGILSISIGGTNAAPANGSITAAKVVLGGTLRITSTVTPVPGTVLTLIDTTGGLPVSGTFLGRPEGSTFAVGGATYRISYAGGDGRDVTLTVI